MTKTIEEQVREYAKEWCKAKGRNSRHVRIGFAVDFAAAREQEIAALRAELADRDTVPRSRYNACNQDQLDADRALTHLRDVAKREITDRDKEIATLRARVTELEGMMPRWVEEGSGEWDALRGQGWRSVYAHCGKSRLLLRLMVPPIPLPGEEG